MKDRFSEQAVAYRTYRPRYPAALGRFLANLAPSTRRAWDCGAGNGQMTELLARHWQEVWATDISPKQLAQAPAIDGVHYQVSAAEQSPFAPASFDLIVAAQAAHWFDLPAFFAEAKRVGQPGAVIALVGYGLARSFPAADALLRQFYTSIVGPYWDPERRHLDQGYRQLAFPFLEFHPPTFQMEVHWDYAQLRGYLSTWSAVWRFQQAQGYDPLRAIEPQLALTWGTTTHPVTWDLLLRVGRI